MKRVISLLLLSITLAGCGVLFPWPEGNYPMTSFYVKNASDKPVDFEATVIKQSTTTGPFTMSVPFTVNPQDSVLARQVGFRKDARPNTWFREFRISPLDGVKTNNPYKPENWKQGNDSKGKTTYTFIIAE
ncbi:hypothetical protein [Salinimicrobium terrae]|uniref:hypothetical protein n=1 Tax=Salinimicrobium terrae TaxID=470866 RepID=UPI0012EC6CE9|nr:hypothetical protein [Salinimicrobium terrae]